jgi:phosphoglycerate dehydrogenase-like enzyme
MPKILLTAPVPEQLSAQFRTLIGDKAEFEVVRTGAAAEFAQKAAEADIFVNLFRPLDAAALAQAPKLRFIQQIGVGYNHLDIKALAEAGILASNTPGVNTQSVAEHTIMLILALLKQFSAATEATRANKWPTLALTQAGIKEIGAATVGLVGFGAIGQAVAERLKPFGPRVFYTSRRRASADIEERLGVSYTGLPDLLASSSIVSLHLPLNAETERLLGANEFARMQPGSLLINVARGGLIDETALRQALENGQLAGAGLDVLTDESDGKNPFADLPQVLVTPHIAGSSQTVIIKATRMAVGNILRYLAGEKPLYLLPELKPR